MDAATFDTLIKRLTTTPLTRANALRGLAASATALAAMRLTTEVGAAKKTRDAKEVRICLWSATGGRSKKVANSTAKKILRRNACAGKGRCRGTNPCPTGVRASRAVCPAQCPVCQTCDTTTGQCVADTGQNRSICGGSGSTTAICCNGACCTGCCARDGACGACLAFVTSSIHDGDLNGLAGADQRCQLHADLAATPLPGSYKAWLGDDTESPATRFRRSAHGYQRVDGVTIADNWADLTDGTLDNPINKTELNGAPQGGQGRVWTNTEADGGQSFSLAECANWESNGSQTGRYGLHTSKDPTWTTLGFVALSCGFSAALYCFQQE